MKKEKDFVVAIDFGTSNSGCTYVVRANGSQSVARPHAYFGDRDDVWKVPTALSIQGNLLSKYIGSPNLLDDIVIKDAIRENKLLFGRHAVDFRKQPEYVYIDDIKMHLYRKEQNIQVGEQRYPLDLIVEIIYRILKYQALETITEEERYKGHHLSGHVHEEECEWVLTTPAIWDLPTNIRMRNIFYRVFNEKDVVLMDEAQTALFCAMRNAILGETQNAEKQDKQYLVVDVGGGTTDMVIAKLRYVDNKPIVEPCVATDGVPEGGENMDQRFIRLYFKKILGLFVENLEQHPSSYLDKLIEKYSVSYYQDYQDLRQEWLRMKVSLRGENYFNIPASLKSLFVKELRLSKQQEDNMPNSLVLSKTEIEKELSESFEIICEKGKDGSTSIAKLLEVAQQNIRIDGVYVFGGGSLQSGLRRKISEVVDKCLKKETGGASIDIRYIVDKDVLGACLIGACFCYVSDIPTTLLARENVYSCFAIASWDVVCQEYAKFGFDISQVFSEQDLKNALENNKRILLPIAIKNKPYLDIEQPANFYGRTLTDDFVITDELELGVTKDYITSHSVSKFSYEDEWRGGLLPARRNCIYKIDVSDSHYGRICIQLYDLDNKKILAKTKLEMQDINK